MAEWTWCPMPGSGQSAKIMVDSSPLGDGYVERVTRGLNPVRPSFNLRFAWTTPAELKAMKDFMKTYGVAGFYYRPPEEEANVLVTVDEWSVTYIDRNRDGIMGMINVTFQQQFNLNVS